MESVYSVESYQGDQLSYQGDQESYWFSTAATFWATLTVSVQLPNSMELVMLKQSAIPTLH